MKKTFPLHHADQTDARVQETIQVFINKYVKRERRKTFPEGFTAWDLHCRVGPTAENATPLDLAEIPAAIEAVALAEHPVVYVEILSTPGHRAKKPAASPVS